jgi:hypothetical protein
MTQGMLQASLDLFSTRPGRAKSHGPRAAHLAQSKSAGIPGTLEKKMALNLTFCTMPQSPKMNGN